MTIPLLLLLITPFAPAETGDFDWEAHFAPTCELWRCSTADRFDGLTTRWLNDEERLAMGTDLPPMPELLTLPGPPTEIPSGHLLVLEGGRAWLDEAPLPGWPGTDQLAIEIEGMLEARAKLEQMTGMDQTHLSWLILAVDRDTEIRRVAQVLTLASELGQDRVAVLGVAAQQPQLSPLPAPAYAHRLERDLEGRSSGEDRLVYLMTRSVRIQMRCPDVAALYVWFSRQPEAMQNTVPCAGWQRGLALAFERCESIGERGVRRLATLQRLMVESEEDVWLTQLPLDIDPTVDPLVFAEEARWSELVPVLSTSQGQPLWLVLD
jgi:hypothetical protein